MADRQQIRGGAESQAAGARGDRRVAQERLGDRAGPGEMALGQPEGVEAQRFGALCLRAQPIGIGVRRKLPRSEADLEGAVVHCGQKLAFARSLLRRALVRAIWVSHFHWDREWYRTFQSFRARL